MRHRVSTVITDVDDTLHDWTTLWHKSFEQLITQIADDTGIDRTTLEAQVRQVFQHHKTCEYGFVLDEIPALLRDFPRVAYPHLYTNWLSAYRRAYVAHLQLFPAVVSTLTKLRERGCQVAAYTESMALYTVPRLKRLGLNGLLHVVYSPINHHLPDQISFELLHGTMSEELVFDTTLSRTIPADEAKPSPQVLLDIISDLGAALDETIYIGDSLVKDVSMAQAASVADVYAKYGAVQDLPKDALLRRLSHWTDEDLQRIWLIRGRGEVHPTYILEHSFAELLDLFDFVAFR